MGLGLYQTPREEVHGAVDAALGAGYRMFDTARVYRNEEALGLALQDLLPKYGLGRGDVWVTSKLGPADHGYNEALNAIRQSSEALLGPVDLYLVHWPGKARLPPDSPEHAAWRAETWRALEEAVRLGFTRHIGVSNYEPGHLAEMKGTTAPYLNQVEVHPLFPNGEVVTACQAMSVRVQAYASIAQGRLCAASFLEAHSEIREIKRKRNCTSAQLFLAWALHRGYSVIPKSVSPERIQENFGALRVGLSHNDMQAIDGLVSDPVSGKVCWDPRIVS